MCIATQHAQVLVAGDAGDLHDIQPLLEQSGRGLVAQIVEAEVLNTGPAYCAHAGALHRLGGDAREEVTV